MRTHLAVAVAILLSGFAVYRTRVTDREVTAALDALRQEVSALREERRFREPTARDAVRGEVPRAVTSLPPRSGNAGDASPSVTGSRRTADRAVQRQAEREAARARYAAGERVRMSEAELAGVRERRREREAAGRERRLARLEDPDARVRARAVFEFDAGDELELAALAAALGDRDADVRIEAVRRLQFGEPATAVPLLVRALADPAVPVVLEAVDSLVFLRDPAAIPDLELLIDHPEERVREEARAAIERL